MRKKKDNQTHKLPTVDVFLQLKPQRLDYEWSTDDEGLVHIKVPKFQGNLGKSFCKLVRKEDTFIANLDKLGSLVWQHCDGTKTVKQILHLLQKAFPQQENMDQRLFVYLQQLKNLNYINF